MAIGNGGGGCSGVFLARLSSLVAAPAADDDAEDDKATDTTGDADDKVFVVAEPAADFVGDRSSVTSALGIMLAVGSRKEQMYSTYVLAFATSDTGCAVEEILVDTNTAAAFKLWTGTGDHAVGVVACVRIVAGRVVAHDSLALHVS